MLNDFNNVSTILVKFAFWTFFYALILDNNFFEHANKWLHMQIHLTSFIEFMMLLNQT